MFTYLRHKLKKKSIVNSVIAMLLHFYLNIAYKTSKWHFIWPKNYSFEDMENLQGVLIALWHNRLAFGLGSFQDFDHSKIMALASPHRDGKIITNLVIKNGFQIIKGSTNRNATEAVKQIIKELSNNKKIVITPDGPRGPKYSINGNITNIAKKYNKSLIALSCATNKYFKLNSWDQMMIPKPFSKIVVAFSQPLKLSDNKTENNELLRQKLQTASDLAEKKLQQLCG